MTATTPTQRIRTPQVRILTTLAKAVAPLTRTQIADRAGVSATSTAELGSSRAANAGDVDGDSLVGLGLVRVEKRDDNGRDSYLYSLTAKGKKLAATVAARKKNPESGRIPADVLDPVVRKFRLTRAYSFELYTDADVRVIRDGLGPDWADVSLDHLRLQVANRRKLGAFADPRSRERASAAKAVRDFGPDGVVIKGLLTAAQVKQLRDLCQ